MDIENMKIKCPVCGKGLLKEEVSDYDTFVKEGASEVRVTVKNLRRKKCPYCEEELLGSDALNRIEKEKYKKLGLLAPEALKIIRERLGLTQEDMSELLAVGKKSYFRWENGLSIQNKSIDRYIRLVDQNPANLSLLQELQQINKGKGYDSEKLAEYITNLKSIEQFDEELVGHVGHQIDIPEELRKTVEELIRKYLKQQKNES